MNKTLAKEYVLTEWIRGKPTHFNSLHIHCPDYSCCYKELLQPAWVRELFVASIISNPEQAGNLETLFIYKLQQFEAANNKRNSLIIPFSLAKMAELN